jgi:hypothetical protein
MRREARLRPEYAHFYPMVKPGVWAAAAVIAEKIAATRLLQLADTFVLHDRVLTDAHFEFRGGSPRRDASPDAHDGRGQPHSVFSRDEVQNPGSGSAGANISPRRGPRPGETKRVTRVREKNS